MQQVPGEVELDDADAPQYFDVEKILRWQWTSKTRRRRREFSVSLIAILYVFNESCGMDGCDRPH